MSFYAHPGAYDHERIRYEALIAEAELVRELDAAAGGRPGALTRARTALGAWLIALGERVAPASRPATQH